ncbi:MAG TPA: hypothetical protein PLF40_26935 [Kofleriaceae bacterium]|jgi:hypothetical protein|nr:hypothetical protein [Kofleriaceae bacterium]
MNEYLFLMHGDSLMAEDGSLWDAYLGKLHQLGVFAGGSSMGAGLCVRKAGAAAALTPVVGFLRVRAENLAAAQQLLSGNPAFEAGATVEIRELLRDE